MHDKNGNPISPGQRVALTGIVESMTSEQTTFCNLMFRSDIGMGPDQEHCIALSARQLELIAPTAPAPEPPKFVGPLPFLFVEGFGPNTPILHSGNSTQFIWDPDLRVHCKRFESIEQFEAQARDIWKQETVWQIFVGFDRAPVDAPDLDAVLRANDLDHILRAVQALCEQGHINLEEFSPLVFAHPAMQSLQQVVASFKSCMEALDNARTHIAEAESIKLQLAAAHSEITNLKSQIPIMSAAELVAAKKLAAAGPPLIDPDSQPEPFVPRDPDPVLAPPPDMTQPPPNFEAPDPTPKAPPPPTKKRGSR